MVTPQWIRILLPLLWWVSKFVFLPHTGDSHIHMKPVNFLRSQMTEAKSIAGYVFYFVTVHYLLNDALEHTPQKMMVTDQKKSSYKKS